MQLVQHLIIGKSARLNVLHWYQLHSHVTYSSYKISVGRPRLSNNLFLAIIERDTLSKARQLARRPAPSVQKDNTASVGLACHGRSRTATKAPNHPQ